MCPLPLPLPFMPGFLMNPGASARPIMPTQQVVVYQPRSEAAEQMYIKRNNEKLDIMRRNQETEAFFLKLQGLPREIIGDLNLLEQWYTKTTLGRLIIQQINTRKRYTQPVPLFRAYNLVDRVFMSNHMFETLNKLSFSNKLDRFLTLKHLDNIFVCLSQNRLDLLKEPLDIHSLPRDEYSCKLEIQVRCDKLPTRIKLGKVPPYLRHWLVSGAIVKYHLISEIKFADNNSISLQTEELKFEVDNLPLTNVDNISKSQIIEYLTMAHGVSNDDQKLAFVSKTEYISHRSDQFAQDFEFEPTDLDEASRIHHKRVKTLTSCFPAAFNESSVKTPAEQKVASLANKEFFSIEKPKYNY